MKFLSGTWSRLLFANYSIDPNLLKELVPYQTQVDQFEGTTFVSLVAFLFENTRIVGVPVPFHRKFEEVNLRFYVKPEKDPTIRGVTFVKELVPKPIIPWIANTLFRENYVSTPMTHSFDNLSTSYSWGKELRHSFNAQVNAELKLPEKDSVSEFITEHYWGYAKKSNQKTLEYHVTHPQWPCCELQEYEISIDFGEIYGKQFGFLNSERPHSVLFAEGSPITVAFPARI